MDDLSFFDYLSPFYFLLIEFHCSFSISYTILQDYVYYCISITAVCDRPSVLFIRARCTFAHTHASLLCVFVCLIVLLQSCCLGKHSCMSCPFPIAILNGTSSFLSLVQENINMSSGHYYRLCS